MKHTQFLFTEDNYPLSELPWLSQGAPENVKDKEHLWTCKQWSLF